MSLLRTFEVKSLITFDVVRESVTDAVETEFEGSGFIHRFNRRERPVYKFDLALFPVTRVDAEYVVQFHAFHQGAKSFLYDGGPYGRIEQYQLIGEGDGSRREFFIPNRYVGANSFSLRTKNQATSSTSNWATSTYSLNPNPGLLTFNNSTNTIPSSGHDIEAIYACQYRCFFEPQGIKVSEVSKGVFRADLRLIEAEIVT